jgi:Kef-type K+ transport system membrane component KefB
LAIATIGVVLAVVRSESGYFIRALGGWGWVLGAMGLGLVCGVCFTLFIGHEKSTSRIFLATVGTVTFAAGVGSALGVSPLFVNLVAGMVVGGLSRHENVLRKELDRLQHPIFVLLLILTGAMWTPVSGSLWLFPLVYLVVRLLAGRVLLHLLTKALTAINPERIGTGLLAQGTLAVAVAVDYSLQVPEHAPVVLTTVLIGTLASDMAAGGVVRRLLVDAEADNIDLGSELGRRPVQREAGL